MYETIYSIRLVEGVSPIILSEFRVNDDRYWRYDSFVFPVSEKDVEEIGDEDFFGNLTGMTGRENLGLIAGMRERVCSEVLEVLEKIAVAYPEATWFVSYPGWDTEHDLENPSKRVWLAYAGEELLGCGSSAWEAGNLARRRISEMHDFKETEEEGVYYYRRTSGPNEIVVRKGTRELVKAYDSMRANKLASVKFVVRSDGILDVE